MVLAYLSLLLTPSAPPRVLVLPVGWGGVTVRQPIDPPGKAFEVPTRAVPGLIDLLQRTVKEKIETESLRIQNPARVQEWATSEKLGMLMPNSDQVRKAVARFQPDVVLWIGALDAVNGRSRSSTITPGAGGPEARPGPSEVWDYATFSIRAMAWRASGEPLFRKPLVLEGRTMMRVNPDRSPVSQTSDLRPKAAEDALRRLRERLLEAWLQSP